MTTNLERNYVQIPCTRDVANDNFTRGVQDYNISVGGAYSFVPSASYFRITTKLTKGDGSDHVGGDTFTLANDVCGNLYNNAYFRAGGSDVSSMVNYCPQGHMLKQRLTKPRAWTASVGKDAFGLYTAPQDPGNPSSVPERKANSKEWNTRDFMYVPALGLFDVEGGLGAGQYRISMNPNSGYERACVEGGAPGTTANAGDYRFRVLDVQFFACIEKNDKAATGTETLYMTEMAIQSKTYSNQLDFTLPPSTKAITVFAQNQGAGSTGTGNIPLTRFAIDNGNAYTEAQIQHLQLTYANVNKPSTNWSSKLNSEEMQITQRYLDTQVACGLLGSDGGTESLNDFIDRGPIYHFNFERDADDRSTHLQLQIEYDSATVAVGSCNIFVCAHYTRTAEVTRTNGMISSVTALSV